MERTNLRIHDINRVLGPVPHDDVPTDTVEGLLSDLTALGVASCSAVASWQLFGDPSGRAGSLEGGAEPLAAGPHPRVRLTPIVVPTPAGTGWPADPSVVLQSGARLVRACPVRHRWSLLSRTASRWWDACAEHGIAVALDLTEVGFAAVAGLAASRPGLNIVALNPGYRELRRCAELLDEAPSILVETGTILTTGGVEWLAGAFGPERLVFGTGGPLLDEAGPTFLLRSLDLPENDVELIAWGNAARLLEGQAQ